MVFSKFLIISNRLIIPSQLYTGFLYKSIKISDGLLVFVIYVHHGRLKQIYNKIYEKKKKHINKNKFLTFKRTINIGPCSVPGSISCTQLVS